MTSLVLSEKSGIWKDMVCNIIAQVRNYYPQISTEPSRKTEFSNTRGSRFYHPYIIWKHCWIMYSSNEKNKTKQNKPETKWDVRKTCKRSEKMSIKPNCQTAMPEILIVVCNPRIHIFLYMLLLLFSHSVVSNSLRPHGLQLARLPCPSPSPGVCSNSCPFSWWCHPTISSSFVPFSFCLQSFPASGSFPMSQLFASDGQSIGASPSVSVLPMNIQDWFPLA